LINNSGEKPESTQLEGKSHSVTLSRIIKSRATVVAGGFIISLLLLVMTAKKINWHSVETAFVTATWLPWLPLAVSTYLIGMLLRGLRLKQLVSTESSLTVATASNIVAVGYATNNILPARLGEFARAGMLAERTGLPYALSLTVTFLERLLDGLTILSLFVLASMFTPTDQWMKTAAAIAAVIFGCAIPCVIILTFSPQLSLSLASQLTIPLGRKWHSRALALVTQITRGLSCFRDASTALSVLCTSFLIWIVEGLMFALVMPCFNLPISVIKAIAVMAFTNLGILIPSSPGYVGPYQICCSTALRAVTNNVSLPSAYNLPNSYNLANLDNLGILAHNSAAQVSESTALSYAVVVHLVFYITVTVWGVIAMARYGLELGTTAALAWEAKPITDLPAGLSAVENSMAIITSVPTKSQSNHCFKVNSFWLAVVAASLPTGSLALSVEDKNAAMLYATEFTCSELGALPSKLRFLFKVGIFAFRSLTTVTQFSAFEKLSAAKQSALLNSWSYGPLALTRKLFKPLRSLALLAFFEHPAVLGALERRSEVGQIYLDQLKIQESNL